MISNSPESTTPVFEWRLIHDGVGKTPNVRTNASTWIYKGDLWVSCGSGSGQGKSSEIWKFDMNIKSWSRVVVMGESPSSRDGQSGTYIGNGKFIIFGGQGFAEPNKKLGKESEGMKTQTHFKRDVLNDLWIFDCESLKWTPVYPNGLSFPMGRRGHSAIYIKSLPFDIQGGDDQQSDFHGRIQSNLLVKPSANSDGDAVPTNCLLVYGGAGIELSKYTEQLYNDVWLYMFDSNTWRRFDTKGVDPTPVTDHKVERVGDQMVVVGGITNVKSSALLGSDLSSLNTSDCMVLNLCTSAWSYIPLYDSFGRVIRINLHGFTLIQDTTIWSDTIQPSGHAHHHSAIKERLTAPLESQKLFIFGGKQVVDSKQASSNKTNKLRHEFEEPILVLNVKDGTLTPLTVRDGSPPESRYSHLGFCGMSIESVEEIIQYNAFEKRSDNSNPSNPKVPPNHQTIQSVSRASSNPFIPKEIPIEETVLFIFGGCDVENGGYCDPALFALVKKNVPFSMANQTSSGPPGSPEFNRPSSPELLMESFSSWSPGRSNSFGLGGGSVDRRDEQSGTSIWLNLQNKQALSNYHKNSPSTHMLRDPSNWEEMKLSLTPSHSERIFDAQKRLPSRQRFTTVELGKSKSHTRETKTFSAPPLLMLNDVDFAYRSVVSHNQGSPRSPWHLPNVDLNGSHLSTTSSKMPQLNLTDRVSGRASTAPARLSKLSSAIHRGVESPNIGDIDPDILIDQKRKRIQTIKSTLQPVVRSQTKVDARESYQKLFPKPYG